jgi:hypothetical protein
MLESDEAANSESKKFGSDAKESVCVITIGVDGCGCGGGGGGGGGDQKAV